MLDAVRRGCPRDVRNAHMRDLSSGESGSWHAITAPVLIAARLCEAARCFSKRASEIFNRSDGGLARSEDRSVLSGRDESLGSGIRRFATGRTFRQPSAAASMASGGFTGPNNPTATVGRGVANLRHRVSLHYRYLEFNRSESVALDRRIHDNPSSPDDVASCRTARGTRIARCARASRTTRREGGLCFRQKE